MTQNKIKILNLILNPLYDEKHEFIIFWIVEVIELIIMLLSMLLNNSMITISLITIFQLPLAYKLLKFEEFKDISTKILKPWKLHYRAIGVYSIFFFTTVIATLIITLIYPNTSIFQEQKQTIMQINAIPTGNFFQLGYFNSILTNNIKVMLIAILTSTIIGAGSLLLLNWNATVLGYAIGSAITSLFQSMSNPSYVLLAKTILKYLLHGIPEVMGYVIAAFAGGIIFAGLINHHIKSKIFKRILFDASDLIIIALLLLIIAAIIETYISPFIL